MRSSIWLFVSLCACGSPGSVDGTVHGNKFEVHDSISAAYTVNVVGGAIHGAGILMSNADNLCPDVTARIQHPSAKYFVISLYDVNNLTFTTPTVPGTYSIYQPPGQPAPKAATLTIRVLDANCASISAQEAAATTGTVTLESVSGNKFAGKYDVALDSGDHITGSFDPEECPGIQMALDSNTQTTCQ